MNLRFAALALCAVLLPIVSPAAEAPLVSAKDAPSFVYPQRRVVDGHSLILHAPQVRSWPDFERFEAWLAVEFTPSDGTGMRYATASVTGDTEVNLETRIVKIRQPKVDQVLFTSSSTPPSYAETIKHAASRAELDVPLDLFLAALADDVLETSAPPGFNTKPPAIQVRNAPTILLYQNGEPVLQPLEKTKLQVMANANWPTFKDPKSTRFYLLAGERWLTAGKVEGPWSATTTLPAEFNQISASGPNAPIRAQIPPKSSAQPAPAVLFSKEPAELIVIEGAAKLETIPETAGLSYVSNTASPLFQLAGDWYFLAAGRWFAAKNLDKGPWTFVPDLPDAFSKIPADHAMADARASVPGTTEARMAVLEATLPKKNAVARDAKPSVQVTYAGDPQFEPIEKTGVSRAVNTSYDVLQVQSTFYLCYQGAWYQSMSANGPWALAASVPAAIYTIPPNSPSYPVTQVVIREATTTTIVYEYPPSYSSNVYVAYGMVVWGTGWYYPPYYGYGYYYPYYGSYGYGTWYNSATGGYGSRSVYYGPYGGYSYNQAYNPTTGRYGYVETAWDGNNWASHGETYNPRTGVSSETSRNYDRYSGESSMERTVERGDNSITTERNTDFREGTQEVSRETSRGGSQESQRQVQDGQMTGSGTIETAGGRTIQTESSASGGQGTITGTGSGGGSGTINTSREPGGGASREGTFTSGSGESINTSTEREGRDSRTDFESSSGGSGTSVRNDGNRTTIAESGSGDLYAGHNGSVYKKSEDGGWSHYEDGNWNTVDMPSKEQRQQANAQPGQTASAGQLGQQRSATATPQAQQRSQSPQYNRPSSMSSSPSASSRDMSQVNRDYSARQTGNRQFSQRSMGGMRGGGGRRR